MTLFGAWATVARTATTAASVLLLTGCVLDADESLPAGPPLCACDPPLQVELEVAPDAGMPIDSDDSAGGSKR